MVLVAVNNLESEYTEPTYGNWRIPVLAGLGRLGGFATVMVFASILTTIFVLRFSGIMHGLITGLVCFVLIAGLSITDKHGYSFFERLAEKGIFMFAKLFKKNKYRSGPLGFTKGGTFRLPGFASSVTPYDVVDSWGRPFTMIHMPAVGIYSVAFAVEPDGASLVDQSAIDQWVANWGGFLAEMGREISLVGVSVTGETSISSGVKLRKEIESTLSPEASPLARQALEEAAMTYPAGMRQNRMWVTISLAAAARSGARRRKPEVMAQELATKMPFWSSHLEATGAGLATPLEGHELAEIIRVAYDPAAEQVLDDAYYQGEDVHLDFENIGPAATETRWEEYQHDSGISVCWTMSEAPRGTVYSNVFARLFAPHDVIDRKRVTILYRPIDSARTASLVERDQNRARTRLTSKPNGSARLEQDLMAANATAEEEAKGAGLTYFGLVVSATVSNPERLSEAVAAVEHELAPSSRIQLRRAYGSHDAVFAATLPLGVMLGKHTLVPDSIKSTL